MLAVRDALAGIRLILRYILNKSHLEYPYLSFCPSVVFLFAFRLAIRIRNQLEPHAMNL